MNTRSDILVDVNKRLGDTPDRVLDALIWWVIADHTDDSPDLPTDPLEAIKSVFGVSPARWTAIPKYTASLDAIETLRQEKMNFLRLAVEITPNGKVMCWAGGNSNVTSNSECIARLKAMLPFMIKQIEEGNL